MNFLRQRHRHQLPGAPRRRRGAGPGDHQLPDRAAICEPQDGVRAAARREGGRPLRVLQPTKTYRHMYVTLSHYKDDGSDEQDSDNGSTAGSHVREYIGYTQQPHYVHQDKKQ